MDGVVEISLLLSVDGVGVVLWTFVERVNEVVLVVVVDGNFKDFLRAMRVFFWLEVNLGQSAREKEYSAFISMEGPVYLVNWRLEEVVLLLRL